MVKVSIIVPVLNTEKYLRQCLDSVIGQTLKDIEIILINDGSIDQSLEIMNEYAKRDRRIKTINQEYSGVSCARNVGIAIATGEYIGFVDSDDYIDIDFYEKLYTRAVSAKADIAKGEMNRTDFDGKKLKYGPNFDQIKKNKANLNYTFTPCIFKRDFLKNNGIVFPPDLIVGEDSFFVMHATLLANKIELVRGVYYHYIRHEESLDSPNLSDKKIISNISFADKSIDFINDLHLDEETYNIVFSHKMSYLLKNIFYKTDSDKMRKLILKSAINLFKKCKFKQFYSRSNPILAEYLSQKNIIQLLRYQINKFSYLKLFGLIPIIKIRRKQNKTIYRLFAFIALLKIKHKNNYANYYLFGFIPIAKKERI